MVLTAAGVVIAAPAAAVSSNNLLTNGEFTAGNSGFTSDYTYSALNSGLGGAGFYSVGTNPALFNGAWPTLAPHAPASEMLIANGSTTANQVVWSETVPVSPHSTYVFSVWAATLYSVPAQLQFIVNGTTLSTRNAPTTIAKWKELQVTWNSGASSSAKLAIVDSSLAFGGNDFALDDISLAGAVPSGSGVAPIAATLGTPGEIFHSVSHDVTGGVVTLAILLFIAFPANIFNQTFSDHYEEITMAIGRVRRRFRHPFRKVRVIDESSRSGLTANAMKSSVNAPGRANRLWFSLTLVAGVFLGGLLNPQFGVNWHSLESLVATLLAFSFGAIVSWFISRSFRRLHKYPSHSYLRALPFGLLIAGACVAVSRLSHFEPGYLYGVVVSVAFIESLADRHSAHLIALTTLSTLAVGVLAWLAWIPMNHYALEPGANFIEVIVDDTLASIFVASLIGSVVSLLPLEGLPGGHLSKWRKDAWGAVFFVALFLLIEVELNPDSGPSHPGGAPVITAIVLFCLFGGLSFGLRGFFRRRSARMSASPSPAAPSLASD
jgi:hypothetical protein